MRLAPTLEERLPGRRQAEAAPGDSAWRSDIAAAPQGAPLEVELSSHEKPTDLKPGPIVGFRTDKGWLLLADASTPFLTRDVTAWRTLRPPSGNDGIAKPLISRLWRRQPRTSNCRAPNTFVLGAGRCGTSSLHAILSGHPDIHASAVKEPTFFCDIFQQVRDPIEYFQLFASPARVTMESSHAYFSNPSSAETLRSLFPDAKFLVTLRAPKNRAYSLWRHMRRLKHEVDQQPYEEIPDFAAALNAEAERFVSRAFAENCRQYLWNFFYCRSSLYDGQIERYFSLFDRRQFHFVSLAELSSAPIETTQGIMRFLDLDPAPVRHFDFRAKNRTRAPYRPYCDESDKIMSAAFEGLTDRTDRLIGRPLDWSI